MNSKHYQIIVVIIAVLVFGLGMGYFAFTSNPTPPIDNTDPHPNGNGNGTGNSNLYSNGEWGFEFQYPKDWAVKENSFRNYYSKFNLVINPTLVKSSNFTILVNIVLPEFAEKSFQNAEDKSVIIISGVQGVKYQYESNGEQETTIILPLGEYRVILGVDEGQYADVSKQFLETFKFLK